MVCVNDPIELNGINKLGKRHLIEIAAPGKDTTETDGRNRRTWQEKDSSKILEDDIADAIG